ncbi:MAG TPA: FAD-dependent oxidoreductase, partial [Ktedonobacteraceae bacterium]|nr:FAD-dependent oxidoreductase [Ktedonobacteraceae bacterium]
RRVVISGSGTLALESAEILRHRGYEVTHLLRGQTLWSEVLDPVASDLVLEEERRDGIDVRTGEEIAEIVGRNGQAAQVVTTRGERIACELVLIAIGIEPLIEFIRASGIACGRGVQVDSGMRTSVPDIFAAGDVIETRDPHSGRTRVLGQWFPAIQQAQVAAYNMLDLLPPGHPLAPAAQRDATTAYMNYYNATLLYGLDFVSVGLTTRPHAPGYTEIVADPQPRGYRKAILKQGVMVGALLLGNRRGGLAFKRAIDARVNVMPVARQLFDDAFDLDAWLDSQHVPEANINLSLGDDPSQAERSRTMVAGLSGQTPTVGVAHRQALATLDEQRVRFEIDMCIGCNRCMDACPVPMSSLVTIADLNSANVTATIAPQVARFTHECIMCGSCVPVCPVDNHRDLLMLSLKERLGVSWKHMPDTKHIKYMAEQLPAGWTVPMLLARLREQAILRDVGQVPDTYLLHMLAVSNALVIMPGETLFREGEYGRDLRLILEGRVELMATDIEGNELPLAILRRGEYAGEDGMLTGLPYKATATAQAPTFVLEVPEQVMQRLMELVPEVRSHFERYDSARSLQAILKRLALFQGVADSDIQALIRRTPVKQYDRDERLFAEDDRGGRPARETLHILLEGFVKVARHAAKGTGQRRGDERILAYRQGGDYFAGGLDLLGDGQAVTVTTINRCRVAEVPRSALLALFQQYPEVGQRFTARLREYVETAVSSQGYALASGPLARFAPDSRPVDAHAQDGLHALVSDGVVEGTGVLVIDLDKCIHCDECEEACRRRHGHSRMNRKGMVVGNISIATACRQCQDPVCMLCSRAGIARHPNGEVYITDSCIGCGICAERCPYGAISIVNIDDEPAALFSLDRFRQFFAKGAHNASERKPTRTLPMVSADVVGSYTAPGPLDVHAPRHAFDELRKKVAIKCDLCAGYSDQACVQACPTGAAVRISPVQFFGSTEEILRRRVR